MTLGPPWPYSVSVPPAGCLAHTSHTTVAEESPPLKPQGMRRCGSRTPCSTSVDDLQTALDTALEVNRHLNGEVEQLILEVCSPLPPPLSSPAMSQLQALLPPPCSEHERSCSRSTLVVVVVFLCSATGPSSYGMRPLTTQRRSGRSSGTCSWQARAGAPSASAPLPLLSGPSLSRESIRLRLPIPLPPTRSRAAWLINHAEGPQPP